MHGSQVEPQIRGSPILFKLPTILLTVLALTACKRDEQPTTAKEDPVEQTPESVSPESKTLVFPGEDVFSVQSQIEVEFGPIEVRQIINSLPPFDIEIIGIGEHVVAFDSDIDFAEYGMEEQGTVAKFVPPLSENYKSHAQFIRLMLEISTPTQQSYFGDGPVESVQIIGFLDNDERRTPMPGWAYMEFQLTEKSGPPSLIDFKGNTYKPRGKPPEVVFEVPQEVVSQTLIIEVEDVELTFKFADLVTHRLLKSPEFLSQ